MQMRKRQIWVGVGLVTAVAAVIIGVVVFGNNVPTDDPEPAPPAMVTDSTAASSEMVIFPLIRGTNLAFEQVAIPTELSNGPKLIIVSYDDAQQPIVNDWLPPLEALNENYPDLAGYYIPLLPKDAADAAAFIIGGFAALANEDERARTLIVFTNVEGFNDIVGVEGLDNVQLFLLDTNNAIVWQTSGLYTDEKLADLERVLAMLPA